MAKAVIRGTRYAEDDIVSFVENGQIRFGEIASVHCRADEDGGFVFRCRTMTVMEYDSHVAAYSYVVRRTDGHVSIRHEDIADYHPLSLYGGRYVVERHLLQKPSLGSLEDD